MSYIEHFNFIQRSTTIDLNNPTKGDLIKIEKLLKAHQQLDRDSNGGTSIGLFLESLKSPSIGISFLLRHPSFIALISNNTNYKKGYQINLNEEEETAIKEFFNTYLENDLIQCCNLAFSKVQYGTITELLNYRDLLPETVIHIIESKTEDRLDYFISIADKIVENSSMLPDTFIALVKALNVRSINIKFRELTSITTSYSMKAIGRSGLSNFFYVMFNGLAWIGRDAKTVQEKIEKREVLKDFRFMSIVLGIIIALFVSVVIYKNAEDAERQDLRQKLEAQQFKKSLYGYLTDYSTGEISAIEPWQEMASGELGFDYFKNASKVSTMMRSVTIVNTSTYELIVLPDKDLMFQFRLPLKNYYVKPNDSTQAMLLFNRIYVGKQLALFKTETADFEINRLYEQYRSRRLPRFSQPFISSKELIKKRFEFVKRIELTERDGTLFLEADGRFMVDGRSVKSYALED